MEDLLHGHPGSDPDLAEMVQTLRAGRPIPPATGALAHLLAGELALTDLHGYEVPTGHRTRRWTRPRRTALLAAVTVVPLLTGAAAANALPAPAQRAAATVLNALTPFTFPAPKPDEQPTRPPAGDRPAPQTTVTPGTGHPTPNDEGPSPTAGSVTHPSQGKGDAPEPGDSGDDSQPVSPSRPGSTSDDGDRTTNTPQGGRPTPAATPVDDTLDHSGGADGGAGSTGTDPASPEDAPGSPAPDPG